MSLTAAEQSLLATHPLFRHHESQGPVFQDLCDRLAPTLRCELLRPGDRIWPGDDEVILIPEGEVPSLPEWELRYWHNLEGFHYGVGEVGLVPGFQPLPGSPWLCACTPMACFRLSRTALLASFDAVGSPFRANLEAWFERKVIILGNRLNQADNRLDDFYIRGHAGMIPGPYEARRARAWLFVVEGHVNRVDEALPPGVLAPPSWAPLIHRLQNTYLVVFAHFPDMRSRHVAGVDDDGRQKVFSYLETTIFRPVLACGVPALYCMEVYPDNSMAVGIGREIYGFPKRLGYTRVSQADLDCSSTPVTGPAQREPPACRMGFDPYTLEPSMGGRTQPARNIDFVLDNERVLHAEWGDTVPYGGQDRPDLDAFGRDMLVTLLGTGHPQLEALYGQVLQWAFPSTPGRRGFGLPSPAAFRSRRPFLGPTQRVSQEVDKLIVLPFHMTRIHEVGRLSRPQVHSFRGNLPVTVDACRGAYTATFDMVFNWGITMANYRPFPKLAGIADWTTEILLRILRGGTRDYAPEAPTTGPDPVE